eukprot:RCo018197
MMTGALPCLPSIEAAEKDVGAGVVPFLFRFCLRSPFAAIKSFIEKLVCVVRSVQNVPAPSLLFVSLCFLSLCAKIPPAVKSELAPFAAFDILWERSNVRELIRRAFGL